MNENGLINNKNIADKQVKFFSWLFSQVPKKITTNIWVRDIYDLATQYFVYWTTNLPIYWSFEYKTIINKIVKTVRGDFLPADRITENEIDEFRKYFYKNPEFQSIITEIFEWGTELKMFNEFLKYSIEYKILEDKNLDWLREIRKYIYMSADSSQSTGDLKQDLYNFFNIQRFAYYDKFHQEANNLLDEIVFDVQQWNIDNPLEFKRYQDRNKLPDKYVTAFEKLVLKNYTYDPITKKEKILVTDYVDGSDLELLKEITKFRPVWRQRRALVMESRENLAANCRRCVSEDSMIRLSDWTFKKAWDIIVWDKLLASDKKSSTKVLRVDKNKDTLYKVTLNTWEVLKLTENHRLPTSKNYREWLFDNNEESYSFVSELKVWDSIPTILSYKSEWKLYSKDESILLWYLLWDWAIASSWVSITKHDKNYVNRIQDLIKNSWLESRYKEEEKIIYIQKSHDLLKKSWMFKKKSAEKQIPEKMFWECDENKYWIIEWLINTDWYIQIKWWKKWSDWYDRKKSVCIEYCSISKELIEWMHILLNDLWIINYYGKKTKKIRLSTLNTDNYEAYYLYITDVDSLRKLFSNIDLTLKKNYKDSIEIINSEKYYTNSNIWTIPLESIKEKKYKSNDWWKTINWIRYPRYNYQRWKAEKYWVEHWLEYQWSQIKSIEKIESWIVVDIEIDWDNLYRIWPVLSHNSWKTRLAVYIAVRQLMLPQQTILYIIPNKEWFSEQPFKYIEEMFDNIKMMADIEWNIPWFQFNNKTFKVTNKEKNSKIIFLSAVWGTKWGRSFSAHLIIMDESWYIEDQDMYHVSSDATADTRWRMRAISTINKDIPINRFFYKKIDLDWADDWQVISVNIYENDFIPDEEKLKKERDLKIKYPNLWLSEWMAIFVWKWDTFDISGFFRLDFDYDILKFWDFSFRFSRKLEKYTRFIIGRDPWRDTDPAGLSVIGIKNRNDAELIATWYMRVPNYIIQKNAVVELYNFLRKMKETIMVIDTGKAGIWMFDLLNSEQIYPYWVMSTASGVVNQRSPREYNIGNNVLEWNLKNVMNNWTLKWFSWLDDIRHEYETFEASKTRSGTKHHHDILSSLMIATTIGLERNFLSFRKEQENKNEVKEVFDDFFGNMKQKNTWWNKFLY